jgi:hypothetical protein
MKILTAVLMGIALWLAPVAAARAENKGFVLEGRVQAGAEDLSLRLRLEADRGLGLRGEVGAGRKQYNFRLRLDGSGLHLETGPTPDGDARPAPPAGRPAPPGLEDV